MTASVLASQSWFDTPIWPASTDTDFESLVDADNNCLMALGRELHDDGSGDAKTGVWSLGVMMSLTLQQIQMLEAVPTFLPCETRLSIILRCRSTILQ